MAAYAVGQFEAVSVGADIVAYLERIDATLAAFPGRFGPGTPRATSI